MYNASIGPFKEIIISLGPLEHVLEGKQALAVLCPSACLYLAIFLRLVLRIDHAVND